MASKNSSVAEIGRKCFFRALEISSNFDIWTEEPKSLIQSRNKSKMALPSILYQVLYQGHKFLFLFQGHRVLKNLII